jgi:hypothetical protein
MATAVCCGVGLLLKSSSAFFNTSIFIMPPPLLDATVCALLLVSAFRLGRDEQGSTVRGDDRMQSLLE